MDAVRISAVKISYTSVTANFKSTSASFKDIFNNQLDKDYNYQRLEFGNGVCYPPKDAPEWFQRDWSEMMNNLSERAQTLSISLFHYTVEYGDWWTMYGYNGDEFSENANARIGRLGYAGVLETIIKSQKHMMESNSDPAYDETLAALERLMDKVKSSGDFTVDNQIYRADMEFYMVRRKNEIDGLIFYELATTGKGLSPSEYSRLESFLKQTAVKFMPDGSVLNIVSEGGRVTNYFKQTPNLLDVLSL